mmetsp:Transcript_95015/g.188227  ORF Transcript_95015/g.188227 Transcript_95015/m.188227 type:complete len:250 (+) Transcript_95015:46-795(+)
MARADGGQAPAADAAAPSAYVALLARAAWIQHEPAQAKRSQDEDYCVCLLERPDGRCVFPGGQVHSMDCAIADGQFEGVGRPADLALRVAAMRSVFAETGVVLAEPAPPGALREATREILRRDGPRSLLDCMIVWDGGNPYPRLTLCPFDEMSVPHARVDERAVGQMNFFITEVPDAAELTWAACAEENGRLRWMKPSEAMRSHRCGEINLPEPEYCVIDFLSRHLSRLAALPVLVDGGLITCTQQSML